MFFIYIDTGYEDYSSNRLNVEQRKKFRSVRDNMLAYGPLIQIDDYCIPEQEKLVDQVFEEVRAKYYKPITLTNPLFMVDNCNRDVLDKLLQMCRDLDYCHIWEDDPIDFSKTWELSNGHKFMYVKVEAESG